MRNLVLGHITSSTAESRAFMRGPSPGRTAPEFGGTLARRVQEFGFMIRNSALFPSLKCHETSRIPSPWALCLVERGEGSTAQVVLHLHAQHDQDQKHFGLQKSELLSRTPTAKVLGLGSSRELSGGWRKGIVKFNDEIEEEDGSGSTWRPGGFRVHLQTPDQLRSSLWPCTPRILVSLAFRRFRRHRCFRLEAAPAASP